MIKLIYRLFPDVPKSFFTILFALLLGIFDLACITAVILIIIHWQELFDLAVLITPPTLPF